MFAVSSCTVARSEINTRTAPEPFAIRCRGFVLIPALSDDTSLAGPRHVQDYLRLLAFHHALCKITPDGFANNRLSSLMDSGRGVHLRHQKQFTTLLFPLV